MGRECRGHVSEAGASDSRAEPLSVGQQEATQNYAVELDLEPKSKELNQRPLESGLIASASAPEKAAQIRLA